jgi:hypothetical protein
MGFEHLPSAEQEPKIEEQLRLLAEQLGIQENTVMAESRQALLADPRGENRRELLTAFHEQAQQQAEACTLSDSYSLAQVGCLVALAGLEWQIGDADGASEDLSDAILNAEQRGFKTEIIQELYSLEEAMHAQANA